MVLSGRELAAPGEIAVGGLDLLDTRYLLVFDLSDTRARDHAGVALDQSSVVTSGECVSRGDSGDDSVCVVVFLVL